MDIHVHLLTIILLWVIGCYGGPRPQQKSTSTTPSPQIIPRSPLRPNDGWSTNTYTPNRGGGSSGSKVVFPTNEEPSHHVGPYHHNTRTPPSKPPTPEPQKELEPCENENLKFCEAEEYPKQYLDNLLEKSGTEFRALFGSDLFDSKEESKDDLMTKIDNLGEEPLCHSVPDLKHPTKGEDISGVTRLILNHDNYTQGIRVETCVGGGGNTCGFGDLVPFGYETYCKQKYIYRRMLALDDDGTLQLIQFPLPSCCVCMVVSSGHSSLQSRLGFSPRFTKYKISNKFTR